MGELVSSKLVSISVVVKSEWIRWIQIWNAGKVHGSLARAGKVRGQTPKVAKQDKKKQPRGRAHKRMQYNRRFVTAGNLSFFFNFSLYDLFC